MMDNFFTVSLIDLVIVFALGYITGLLKDVARSLKSHRHNSGS